MPINSHRCDGLQQEPLSRQMGRSSGLSRVNDQWWTWLFVSLSNQYRAQINQTTQATSWLIFKHNEPWLNSKPKTVTFFDAKSSNRLDVKLFFILDGFIKIIKSCIATLKDGMSQTTDDSNNRDCIGTRSGPLSFSLWLQFTLRARKHPAVSTKIWPYVARHYHITNVTACFSTELSSQTIAQKNEYRFIFFLLSAY